MQNHNITEIGIPANIVRLPETCPRNRNQFTYCRVLTGVDATSWRGVGFNGKLYKAGARVAAADLGAHPVALEFAGPQGLWKCRTRENLWILWRYEWRIRTWREISRALAFGSEWVLTLRDPAIRALQPPVAEFPGVDPAARGREVTAALLLTIDTAVSREIPAVRLGVLTAIYDQIAGRLAVAA